jgi:hypothetical protein
MSKEENNSSSTKMPSSDPPGYNYVKIKAFKKKSYKKAVFCHICIDRERERDLKYVMPRTDLAFTIF